MGNSHAARCQNRRGIDRGIWQDRHNEQKPPKRRPLLKFLYNPTTLGKFYTTYLSPSFPRHLSIRASSEAWRLQAALFASIGHVFIPRRIRKSISIFGFVFEWKSSSCRAVLPASFAFQSRISWYALRLNSIVEFSMIFSLFGAYYTKTFPARQLACHEISIVVPLYLSRN